MAAQCFSVPLTAGSCKKVAVGLDRKLWPRAREVAVTLGRRWAAVGSGWPLSSDSWEAQMFHLASNGYRCVAHDRRGHRRVPTLILPDDDDRADDRGREKLDRTYGIVPPKLPATKAE